jgi:peptidoglycan/xylan/chitin deacetylase (PgdA/CDA1 family)
MSLSAHQEAPDAQHLDSGTRAGDCSVRSRFDVVREAFVGSRLLAPAGRFWSGFGTCLMYHRVCADDVFSTSGYSPNRELIVRESEFDAQMRYISTHCNCLSLPQAVALLRQRKLPRRSIVVTFDDGYLDNLTVALPILRTYGVPATIYVTTGIIEQTADLWWYELESVIRRRKRLEFDWNGTFCSERIDDDSRKKACFLRLNQMLKELSPAEQRRLLERIDHRFGEHHSYAGYVLDRRQVKTLAADPLITIGAHTHNHPVLSRLSEEQLLLELDTSRRKLEEWTENRSCTLPTPSEGMHRQGRGNSLPLKKRVSSRQRQRGLDTFIPSTRIICMHCPGWQLASAIR